MLGVSTVKWTTPYPCLVFSEGDLKLYTNFEFCDDTNHRHLKNILIYKANETTMTKNSSKKTVHFLEDNASGVQVGDIEQVIV